MTRTIYYVAASLDGFIADPDGGLEWLFQFNDTPGVTEHYERFLEGVGALAMGASTYEFFLGEAKGTWPYANRPTWVFTHRSLPSLPGADLRFTTADVREVHRELVEAAGGKNVWMMGGGKLAAQFAEHGLLDELRLTVVPVFLGKGIPLLPMAISQPAAAPERHPVRSRDGRAALRVSRALTGAKRG